ncbi:MAG: FtsX-like permease family protein [Bacteroides sp.]|nr:FtsX-like permease family protein [Bacteroides sp.]
MNNLLYLKLIARNWWRNKTYFFISLFSLTIGLACTNLLVTFFIHEYNIESTNPNRENIYVIRQDSPMEEGELMTYTTAMATEQIKNNYAEVESMLRMNTLTSSHYEYQGNKMSDVLALQVDSTLLHFFPYEVKEGSLKEALTTPDKVALTETYAQKVFGKKSCIGEVIESINAKGERKSYQIAAILKERPQSFLQFDMLTSIDESFFGGVTLLKLPQGADKDALLQKIKDDKVPTLMPGETEYYLHPIKDIYFASQPNSKQQPLPFLHQANVQLLYIALFSALLVLVIACFNYSNLNLSRTLQQLKMIHIEKLMGAQLKEIRMQLFLDATLTVLIAFSLSLLLINDILVLFNDLLTVQLPYRFFFSWQVLPVLLTFVLLLAITPGIYISHRLSRQSLSEYRKQYTGQSRQRIVWALVTIQFILSLGLVYATLIAQNQMSLIKSRAFRYENMIEIGDMFSGPALQPFQQKLALVEGIEAMTLSSNSILGGFIMQLIVKQPDGSEEMRSKSFIHTEASFFPMMQVRILEGLSPEEAIKKYGAPFYINENYARWMNIRPEDIGTKTLQALDENYKSNANAAKNILAGIIENMPTNSLQETIMAQEITLHDSSSTDLTKSGKYLQIRLNPEKRETAIKEMERIWKEMFEGQHFVYSDMHQMFLQRNQEVMQLSNILNTYSLIALLLTCFGLFGISWYAVRQRIREIAIRKVHGASTLSIIWLLNRPFFIQIMIAYIIAMPIAWWLMQHWLEQFVERAEAHIGLFIVPLLVVGIVSLVTVSLHTLLAAKSNPLESLKTE